MVHLSPGLLLPLPSVSRDCCVSPFRDRSCTVLNVEGDAFGAGLLQSYVDRTKMPSSEPELIQVKNDVSLKPLPLATEEGNPLLKQCREPSGDSSATCEKESVM